MAERASAQAASASANGCGVSVPTTEMIASTTRGSNCEPAQRRKLGDRVRHRHGDPVSGSWQVDDLFADPYARG